MDFRDDSDEPRELAMTAQNQGEPKHEVLVVDDDEALLRAHERVLAKAGYGVTSATSGSQAIEHMKSKRFDAIVSDINMPGLDGIELLGAVRQRDLDLPVILVTGAPSLDTAVLAVHHGAFRYLFKPISPEALRQVVHQAVRLYAWARLRRQALAELGNPTMQVSDRAGLEAAFGRAMETLTCAYQPIVSWSSKRAIAYEALMRVKEASLPIPPAVLSAAERLDRLNEVGQAVRARVAKTLDGATGDFDMFVNVHPRDLCDETMYDPSTPLAQHAKRVVYEITERANLDDIPDVKRRIINLREMGFRVAVDDIGAGYAGLTSFAHLEPDFVKIDMSIVRDVHTSPVKQRLVRAIAGLGNDLGIGVIAEGVETHAERDVLLGEGCDILQGYLFAKPVEQLQQPKF